MKKLIFTSSGLALLFVMASSVACFRGPHYHYRARTSEAKIQLAAAYTAQQAFYGDFALYAGCLKYMGYDPSREISNRYYSIGIKNINISQEYAQKVLKKHGLDYEKFKKNCLDKPVHFYPGGKFQNGALVPVTLKDFPEDSHVTVDKDGKMTFKMYAIAKGKHGHKSVYSITQDKKFDVPQNDLWDNNFNKYQAQSKRSGYLVFFVIALLIYFAYSSRKKKKVSKEKQ